MMNPAVLEKWMEKQLEGSLKVLKKDEFFIPINFVGGIDISFVDQSAELSEFEAVGALVILDYCTLKVVYSDCIEMKTEIPYISGYLGFREEPFAEILYKRLCSNAPEFRPQILFVDGCGIYHPRGFGSASQIGVKLDIATIGISKSFLKIDQLQLAEEDFILDNISISSPIDLPVTINSSSSENTQVVAMALYNGTSKHPRCYVSIGHKISLQTAINVAKRCSLSKIPEPIRQADLISREYIQKGKETKK